MSLDYIFTFQDSYTGLRIGPVMAMHQVSENGSTGSEQRKTTVKPGINLGFDAALFEKKSWFMAISMGYSWIPPVSIGPYEKIIHYATADGVDTITSIYPDSKIPLSSLKIGLTMGWKF
jgi:hypothetical protein